MRRYNIWRPIMLILVAMLTRSVVTNVSLLFGLDPVSADNLGFIAMIIAAFVVYFRITKQQRK